MKRIIVPLSSDQRLICYSEGGCNVEFKIPGMGWYVEVEEDMDDNTLVHAIEQAEKILATVKDKLMVK